jgi:RNA polymerase sigma-70 factor (ECF subfamily)
MDPVDDAEWDRRARFEQLYVELHPAVSAYVVRRLPELTDPGDVLADVFTVVWRRLDELPRAPADRLWIYGVARRCVSQAMRSSARRDRLTARLGAALPALRWGDPDIRLVVRDAIAALPNGEAEALRLVAWDGLSHEEAAYVLECSVNAVAIRLHRARKRLERLLADEPASGQSELADGGSA